MAKPFKLKLVGDYEFDEVSSALQKTIRRGMEYEAAYWAYVLHQSGFGSYLWRRLITITSEDIGNGDPQAATVVSTLTQSWEYLNKRDKETSLNKFFPVIHAVLYLCRCPKSREDDSLLNLIHEQFELGKRLEIPAFAIDPHTAKGKKLYGRLGNLQDGLEKKRWERWFDESTQINLLAYPDKWEAQFRELVFTKIDEKKKNATNQ